MIHLLFARLIELFCVSHETPKTGAKMKKERVTVHLVASAVEEKFHPQVVGKSRKPQVFKAHGVQTGKPGEIKK